MNPLQAALSYLSNLIPSSTSNFDFRPQSQQIAQGSLPGQALDPKNNPKNIKTSYGITPEFAAKIKANTESVQNPVVQSALQQSADPNYHFAFENYKNEKGWTPPQPPKDIGNIIRNTFPNEATKAALLAATENARYNPTAVNDNGGSNGLDTGIFQVNSNTFNGLMKRRGSELASQGINNYNQMNDPLKNAQVAKMILGEGGAGRWFGWQNYGYDLNNGQFTVPWKVAQLAQQAGK